MYNDSRKGESQELAFTYDGLRITCYLLRMASKDLVPRSPFPVPRFPLSPFSFEPSAFSQRGFTLLEVLVALAILSVALIGLLGLHNRNVVLALRAEHLSTATLLAREMLTRTQLEGTNAARVTNGDFAELHPGQYEEFRWQRTVRPAPLEGLWELRVSILWGEREDERCELTLFAPLS
ncbi:MAG: prepilin-type N-terminal cleavage/methylation domain-containing protein [Candidatus Binatia bacterium]